MTSGAAEGSATDGPNDATALMTAPHSPRRTTFLASTDTGCGSVLGGALSRLRSMRCYQQGVGEGASAAAITIATTAGGTGGDPGTPRRGYPPKSALGEASSSEPVMTPRSRLQRCSALPHAAVRRSAMLSSFVAKRSLLLEEMEEEETEREEVKEEQSFFLEAVRRGGRIPVYTGSCGLTHWAGITYCTLP